MGNGSGPGRFSSRIYTNSWGYQAQRQFANQNLIQRGDSFYGLTKPQYQSTIYHVLSNNGPGVGARIKRYGSNPDYSSTAFKLYSIKPHYI